MSLIASDKCALLNHPLKARTLLSTAIAGALLMSTAAIAQTQDGAAATVEQIVVTGSRIARDGYNTPTPVSVLNEEDIQAEAPGSVAEFAMSLPSIQGSTTASTSSGSLSSGTAGIAALNLRGLGTGRSLVLFDGQRSVASAAGGQVDTNTFPQSLVERIEVVSGGASSAYGSDAIAGVVNFILDRDYTGLKTSIEYGEITQYDAPSEKFTVTAGTDYAGGAGHILFSAEKFDQQGIHYTVPDWADEGYMGIVNPDKSPGAPYYFVGSGIGISSYTPGGLITAGPLRGTYFGEGGSVNKLNYGKTSGQWMVGGDWQTTLAGELGTNSLQADDQRDSLFGRVSYEIAPNLEVFGQGSYSSYEGLSYYINPTDTNRLITIDNAFLPASVVSAMQAANVTSFRMGSSNADMPASGSNNKRETTRFVAGIEGEFAVAGMPLDWNAYYQLGKTATDEHETPTWNFERLTLATDAVRHPATGEIVCRSTISSPANGCVPLNRFGTGVASDEALAYVLGRPRREQELTQDVAAINFTLADLEGWAGPIGVAFGAEWREESIDGFVDPQFVSGWKYGNYKVTTGKVDVNEYYFETVVPVVSNLEFNGAARYTDYSTSGGVTTWKAGITYAPISDVTLRVTQSRDIRAPNLSELYDAGTARTNAVAINGQSTPFIQNLQGTPTVGPEEADALGVGVVLQPSFLPGFALSVDYYDIEVDGVISFINAQGVADACLIFKVASYCDNLRYGPTGALQYIDLEYENLNSLISEGVDLETSYTIGVDELFDRGVGDISIRYLGTNYLKNITDDGVTAIDDAGRNTGSTPDWLHRLSLRYTLNEWTFNLTGRGHSDGVVDNAYIECSTGCPPSVAPNFTINDNSIDGEWFFDAYVARGFTLGQSNAEVFLSVKNVFDTDPVLMPFPSNQGAENRAAYFMTNRGLMDMVGRNFRMGMRVDF